MTTPTLTLAEFYRARLDEREAKALESEGETWEARQLSGPGFGTDQAEVVQPSAVPDRGFYRLGMDCLDGCDARHVAANDPAFVLADIAIKRRIVEECERWPDPQTSHVQGYASAFALAVRLLASAFDSHPDWREEWRP